MDEIEIKIKVTPNPILYKVKIKKSDEIITLKKLCEKYTNISHTLQNFVFDGQILSDEQKISDYNIENGTRIILVKKLTEPPPKSEEEEKEETTTNKNISNNSIILNNNNQNINADLSKNIAPTNNISNRGNFDLFASLFNNLNINDIEKIKEKIGGIGQKSGLGEVDQKLYERIYNNPQYIQAVKNLLSNPECLKLYLEIIQSSNLFKNNPFIEKHLNTFKEELNKPEKRQILAFVAHEILSGNNPDLMPSIINIEKIQNNIDNNPFEFDFSQYSWILGAKYEQNGLGEINNNNKNDIKNKKQKRDNKNEVNIKKIEEKSFEEKYREDLESLKNMGFTDEEKNKQILKECKGRIDLAIDKLEK